MASTKSSSIGWVDEELKDLLEPDGLFRKALYVADDRNAPLHPTRNKGNEANIYLSYIIDHYDNLADVSIFVHPDRWAWHNNELMDNDLAGMIRYLKPETVVRDGYMNLRCHWVPGCPDWLFLHQDTAENIQKNERKQISERWSELFPLDEMPQVLSQPCCAQFAVSRDRILAIPKQRYVYLRTWILRTPLQDYHSGRVFEYLWQYIFTGNGVVCPTMHTCYCEGFGICFDGEEQFDKWFELRYQKAEMESRMRKLRGKPGQEVAKSDKSDKASHKALVELGKDASVDDMQAAVTALKSEMQRLRDEAFLRGRPVHHYY
ncbi:hypothetical protein CAC42_8285 [Sphaceloma murrayae]|uniref:Uncharacterized protein n=1 Tax=Sphaceloma murrayae TaxID=2082308 RepID=A0A2K1QJD7_9PEZI|nr:hypothetical protein CAC42_8285 [Sphaceloma murrayae]